MWLHAAGTRGVAWQASRAYVPRLSTYRVKTNFNFRKFC